jgi:hypothetical protein
MKLDGVEKKLRSLEEVEESRELLVNQDKASNVRSGEFFET